MRILAIGTIVIVFGILVVIGLLALIRELISEHAREIS